jgi:C1A family cysteine protease
MDIKNIKSGWIRDLPDHRDFVFQIPKTLFSTELPPSFDLRQKMPPVYDQGQIGDCVANALASIIQFDEKRQQNNDQNIPSRLFMYFNARAIEGTVASDAGCTIRDSIKALSQNGFCDETSWPYTVSDLYLKPPPLAYSLALKERIQQYSTVPQNLIAMKTSLLSGNPIIFGMRICQSFVGSTSMQTGMIQYPGPNEQPIAGHCMVITGYDDSIDRFFVRNSWGTGIGINGTGYFAIPYSLVLSLQYCSDIWNLTFIPRT